MSEGSRDDDSSDLARSACPAIITRCVRNGHGYEWHLAHVKRYKRPRTVNAHPQPVWFRPFS